MKKIVVGMLYGLVVCAMASAAPKKINSCCTQELMSDGFIKNNVDTNRDGKVDLILYEKGRWIICFDHVNKKGLEAWHVAVDKHTVLSYGNMWRDDGKIDYSNVYHASNVDVSFFDTNKSGKFNKWIIFDWTTLEGLTLWDDNGDLIPDKWKLETAKDYDTTKNPSAKPENKK